MLPPPGAWGQLAWHPRHLELGIRTGGPSVSACDAIQKDEPQWDSSKAVLFTLWLGIETPLGVPPQALYPATPAGLDQSRPLSRPFSRCPGLGE